jgi:hypothetical protein
MEDAMRERTKDEEENERREREVNLKMEGGTTTHQFLIRTVGVNPLVQRPVGVWRPKGIGPWAGVL